MCTAREHLANTTEDDPSEQAEAGKSIRRSCAPAAEEAAKARRHDAITVGRK
jgi:hypothetical protein